jgi:hypothetical protein
MHLYLKYRYFNNSLGGHDSKLNMHFIEVYDINTQKQLTTYSTSSKVSLGKMIRMILFYYCSIEAVELNDITL